MIALNILPMYNTGFEAFHHSFFQVSSIITTTGFATVNFDLWPQFSRIILVLLMIIGASAGSTGGGIKVVRLVMIFKAAKHSIQKLIHPRSVKVMKMNGKVVDEALLKSVFNFIMLYFIIMAVSILLVALDNFNMETTITSVITCIGNVGPGLNMVGPIGNFSVLSNLSKIVLSFDMLVGRLEVFPMLMLFVPQVWKRER